MHSKFLLLIWIAIASCVEPVEFERNNMRDPGNPDYTPHPPLNLTVTRSGRDMLLSWYLFPGGSDSIWIQKSIKGSDFQTVARIASAETGFRDTTRNLDYPSTYRIRSVYHSSSVVRVSEPADFSLPVPILGRQAGESVGMFGFAENWFGGTVPNFSGLYGYRIHYQSSEYGLSEYVPSEGPIYTAGTRGDLNVSYQRFFEHQPCPFVLDATFQVYLPSSDGDRLVQEHPIGGSPFVIPFFAKRDQFDEDPSYSFLWVQLRRCEACLIDVHRSVDQGDQWSFLEQIDYSAGAYDHTSPGNKPWYRLSLRCGDKIHPETIEYRF